MSDLRVPSDRWLKPGNEPDDKNWVTDIEVMSQQEALADPFGPHESIAGVLAAQGEWRQAYEHLRTALDRAREESLRDALTATYNRRFLDLWLASRPRAVNGLALALVDLDLFKRINDTFGHPAGDHVLRRTVSLLRDGLPPGGFCARYGGEEFALVLPGVPPGTALGVAERARDRVARHSWPELATGFAVTVSIGLAYQPSGRVDVPHQLKQADRLLYAAKHAGRNAVAYRERGDIRIVAHGR
nr:GGDEF domain-containing protein [Amycolatopsis anabasis]